MKSDGKIFKRIRLRMKINSILKSIVERAATMKAKPHRIVEKSEKKGLRYPFFSMFDSNSDDKISPKEWIDTFLTADLNQDMQLSVREMQFFFDVAVP